MSFGARAARPEPVVQRRVPPSGALGADGDGERAPGASEDDQFLGPGDRGVEQIALKHHPGSRRERYNDGGVFAALRAVDGDRVSVRELVQLIEPVVDRFILVGDHGHLVIFNGQTGNDPDSAVEDACGALLIVVPQLRHLVPDAEHPAAVPPFRLPLTERRQRLLQQQVQVAGTGGPAVHRAKHLDVTAWVQAELRRDTPRDDVYHERCGFLGLVARKQEEITELAQQRLLSRVDPVCVDDDPGLLRLAEDLGQPYHGQRSGGEQVA
jgi:hypothetical protein